MQGLFDSEGHDKVQSLLVNSSFMTLAFAFCYILKRIRFTSRRIVASIVYEDLNFTKTMDCY
jgi:hypothetical protein